MSYILTVDQSTFSTKVLLVDEKGDIQASTFKEHKQYYPKNGWVEQDATEIYNNFITCVKQLKKDYPSVFKQIKGLAITNQRETTVLWNTKTKKPLHHAIVWQCRRTIAMCKALKEQEEVVEEITGLKIDPYFSATKLNWLLNYCEEDIDKNYAFGTMETWLIYNLTGLHVSDVTNASRTLLMDIEKMEWSNTLCAIFGIPQYLLPTIIANDTIIGYTDIEGLLDIKIPICGVIADSQAALYAQHCFDKGDMKVTLGTGSSILKNLGNTTSINKDGEVLTVAWKLDDEITYASEAIINCSGDTLNWLKNQLGLFNKETELDSIWETVLNNDGLYLVPAFVGLSVPWWQPDAKASITGLARNHTKEHILRAGLESIVYQIYDATSALGYQPDQVLHVDGGASKNTGLLQFMADILNMKIKVPKIQNLSAFGAYEIARRKILNIEVKHTWEEVYIPNMEPAMRNKNIKGWHQAIKSVVYVAQAKEKE
jgi:glycerol kinase